MSDSPEAVVNDTPSKQDAKGRFVRGNVGGPGNPFGRQVAELRKAMLEAVTASRIRNIAESMVQRAESGDVAAAKLVLQYTLGKPAAAVEPDRIDIDEHRLRAESAVPVHVWGPMLEHLQAGRVNQMADALGPLLERRIIDPLAQIVFDEEPTGPSRAKRKAMRREMRRLRREAAPSPNGVNGAGSKRRSDKVSLPLDRGFGPDRAG